MDLREIAESIRDCGIITDIYSGNHICNCGKRLILSELHFGSFGSSLACACGNRFWITSDEEGTEDLLIYEGFDYIQEDTFIVVKQRAYAAIDWTCLKLDEGRLKEEREYLELYFPDRRDFSEEIPSRSILAYIKAHGDLLDKETDKFFSNFTVEDMTALAKQIEKYCSAKGIIPNYGALLSKIVSGYNVFELEEIYQTFSASLMWSCCLRIILTISLSPVSYLAKNSLRRMLI
jgi:hypothetical protein